MMSVEQILDFMSRTDVAVCVFVSLLVALLTLWYISRNEPRIEIQKLEYVKRLGKNGKDDENETEDLTTPDNEDANKDDETSLSEREARRMLLDEQDMEMIKKGVDLDTKDPSSVKHYVQEIRTMSYKGKKMTDVEQEREEEAKRKQLSQIFALMNQNKETFGEMSVNDLEEQMAMYQK